MANKDDKLQQFSHYDFDSSEEWRAHLRNIELPANSAAALMKVKAKWYRKTVDPDFDPAWATPAATAANPSVHQQSSSGSQQQHHHHHQQQPRPPSGGSTAAPPHQAAPGEPDSRTLTLVALQGMVLVLTVLYLQPLKASLSSWAYSTLINILLLSQLMKLTTANGLPPSWSWAAVKPWASRALNTSDAQYFLLALGARFSYPVTALLTPFVVLALYNVAYFLSQHCSQHPLWRLHGAKTYLVMMQHQQHALLFNAQSEILLGFFMIASLLLPKRQPMLTLVVWSVLRLRYWSTDAAWYHRQIWGLFDEKTRVYRQRFPYCKRWWTLA